ncbi:MAG: aminotransferase class IV [Patescibacteria group bacterium]
MTYCYLNGKIIPEKNAKVSVTDIGVLRGYGAFDVIRTYRGTPFLFNEHFARTEKAARALGVRMPIAKEKLLRVMLTLVKKNGFSEAAIRVVLTGGPAIGGIRFHKHTPTLYILATKLELPPPHAYTHGVTLMTHEYRREHPEVKTLNYFDAVSLQKKLRARGAFEILYVWEGDVLEASTSNFFIFRGDTLVTPKDGVLKGVTRNKVIARARRYFQVRERDVPMKEVWEADEAFITATNKDVVPVTRIDGTKIGNGNVGPRTRRIMALFRAFMETC